MSASALGAFADLTTDFLPRAGLGIVNVIGHSDDPKYGGKQQWEIAQTWLDDERQTYGCHGKKLEHAPIDSREPTVIPRDLPPYLAPLLAGADAVFYSDEW
eukprot:gene8982-20822_t